MGGFLWTLVKIKLIDILKNFFDIAFSLINYWVSLSNHWKVLSLRGLWNGTEDVLFLVINSS